MDKHSYPPTTVTQQVEEFILEMRERTGVSQDFLMSIKPAVRRMFESVAPNELGRHKDSFIRKAEIHVQTLAHLSSTLAHLQKLTEREKANPIFTPEMAHQLAFTKGIVVNTLLKTYGGFGAKVVLLG